MGVCRGIFVGEDPVRPWRLESHPVPVNDPSMGLEDYQVLERIREGSFGRV